MKKIRLFFIITLSIIAACALFAGCSALSKEETDPISTIQREYGNCEFNISFNSEGLKEPIESITYSAYVIPSLPTPVRIGYIFEGWYMDASYTTPYYDNILYLYMSDVTLYAKWSREEFVLNGVYEIEFNATVIDKENVDKNFAIDIISTETYIEKTDGDLRLRIQYDCGQTVGFGEQDVYSVSINYAMTGTDVILDERISPDTESVKTVYFDINNFDITQPIYFNIRVYKNNAIADTYVVRFSIVRLLGFSKGYVNPDEKLEDGYYLVKTNYKATSGADSMMENYNPIYSYIIAENGNYTLVKPFSPYRGLIVNGGMGTLEDYYNRYITFASSYTCYEIETASSGTESETAYIPEVYGATKYVGFSYEFHADSGKFYNVIDLGNSVKKTFMLCAAPSGFMELMNMGSVSVILTIDYDHILKLSEIDYEPLSGDYYGYTKQVAFYPGGLNDLNSATDMRAFTQQYGTNTNVVNFFYGIMGNAKQIYSSRISIVPSQSTANLQLKDSRYTLSYFNVISQIYGYDPTNNTELYADCVTVNTFGGNALRETIGVKQGKSYNVGETVWLSDLADEFIGGGVDFSSLTYRAYFMDGYVVNFAKAAVVEKSFVFEKNIAILFSLKNSEGTVTQTLVEVVAYREPTVDVQGFDESDVFITGTNVAFPAVTYEWMGHSCNLFGDLYLSGDGELRIDGTKVVMFDSNDNLSYVSGKELKVPTDSFILSFMLNNRYGEIYILNLQYRIQNNGRRYEISDMGGTVFSTGTINFDSNGKAENIAVNYDYCSIITESTLHFLAESEYYLNADGISSVLSLKQCKVLTATTENSYKSIEDIKNAITGKYALLTAEYTDEHGNTFFRRFTYGIYFNGKTNSKYFTYAKMFTNYDYYFNEVFLTDGEVRLGEGTSVRIYKSVNGAYSFVMRISSGTFRFDMAGHYMLVFSLDIGFDEFGKRVFYGSKNLTLYYSQEITVEDGNGTVTVAYITDSEHPFAAGISYTVFEENGKTYMMHEQEYGLSSAITTYGGNNFIPNGAMLFAWVMDSSYTYSDTSKLYFANTVIGDFIGEFNNDSVKLYALWDEGLNLTFEAEDVSGNIVTIYKIVLYRSTNNTATGTYTLNLNSVGTNGIYIPTGYIFVGWTGGIFGDEVVQPNDDGIWETIELTDGGDYKIRAIVKQQFRITYYIDYTYSYQAFASENVYDGGSINNISDKLNIACRVEGYEFKGWYIQGDVTKTIMDLETYIVTDNVTFVALFGPIGE